MIIIILETAAVERKHMYIILSLNASALILSV